MSFTLLIGGRMPGLNELLNAKGTVRGQWNGYNAQKQIWYGQIKLLATAAGLTMQGPGMASFLFLERDSRRDPDNIVAGGVKLALDALVGAEVLPGDGQATVLGFVGYWTKRADGRVGCLVHWADEIQTKDAMLAILEKEIENVTAKQENWGGLRAGGDGRNHARLAKVAGRVRRASR